MFKKLTILLIIFAMFLISLTFVSAINEILPATFNYSLSSTDSIRLAYDTTNNTLWTGDIIAGGNNQEIEE